MSKDLLEEIRRRAFRELSQRDVIGTVLDLDYEQTQLLKQQDHRRLRPILEKTLLWYKRSLWWMGIGGPMVLALIFWWFETPTLAVILTLLFVAEVAFLLKISLPRIAAMERARVLLDLYDSRLPNPFEPEK